jgi:hypothetical protein
MNRISLTATTAIEKTANECARLPFGNVKMSMKCLTQGHSIDTCQLRYFAKAQLSLSSARSRNGDDANHSRSDLHEPSHHVRPFKLSFWVCPEFVNDTGTAEHSILAANPVLAIMNSFAFSASKTTIRGLATFGRRDHPVRVRSSTLAI